MAEKRRTSMRSTEPQARKVVEGINSRRKPAPPKKKTRTMDETKPTARSPKGVQKSAAQGQEEKAALRKKQQQRVQAAKKKRSY